MRFTIVNVHLASLPFKTSQTITPTLNNNFDMKDVFDNEYRNQIVSITNDNLGKLFTQELSFLEYICHPNATVQCRVLI
jgi:hypothetical protein